MPGEPGGDDPEGDDSVGVTISDSSAPTAMSSAAVEKLLQERDRHHRRWPVYSPDDYRQLVRNAEQRAALLPDPAAEPFLDDARALKEAIDAFERSPSEDALWCVVGAAFKLGGTSALAGMFTGLSAGINAHLKGALRAHRVALRRDPHNKAESAAAEARHARWREEAVRIWAENPGLKTEPCAELVRKRLAVTESKKTVARAIRAIKPMRS